MKIEPLGQVKARFSHFVRECQREPIVITKNGKVAAMLVGTTDEDIERMMLSKNPTFNEIIRDAEESALEEGMIAHEDFWAMVESDARGEKDSGNECP